MSDERNKELLQFLEHAREERNLEYKESMDWADSGTQHKVVVAAMAMANIQDGGTLVFGMKEVDDGSFISEGMDPKHYASFNQDDVQVKVNSLADPYVNLVLNKIAFKERLFVIIQVQQFDTIPVICKRDSKEMHQGKFYTRTSCGDLYTRSWKKYESSIIKTQNELREIIDLATEIGIKSFYSKISRVGLSLNSGEQSEFDTELEGL